jgi:hypothetical protein
MMIRKKRLFSGIFSLPVLAGLFLFVRCDLFNNSMSDYFLDNTETVEVTGVAGKTLSAVMTNGTILIPPATEEPVTTIGAALLNPRDFTGIRLNLSDSGSAAGTAEARQTGPGEIEVDIAGAAEGEEYILTLAMQSPDGLRDFAPFTMRLLCVSFDTSLQDIKADGATPPGFNPASPGCIIKRPYGTTSVLLEVSAVNPAAVLSLNGGSGTGTVSTTLSGLAPGNNVYTLGISAGGTAAYTVTVYVGADDAKAITECNFTIAAKKYGAGSGTEAGSGSINEALKTITVTVPYGTNRNGLAPAVTHTGAGYAPTSSQNFTAPQTYTVTAMDGSIQPYTVTVSTATVPNSSAEIQNAINNIPANSSGTITLPNGTVAVTGAITIGGNRDLTIVVDAGDTAVLERDDSYTAGGIFNVENGSTLTLGTGGGDLVVDGGWDTNSGTGIESTSAAITVNGDLVLEDGVTVQNNKNRDPGEGGGIYVDSTGSLEMNGGAIQNNEGGDGGGVSVAGRFEMNGGTISGNQAKPGNANPDGGGVLVQADGTFVMTDGEIADNYAQRYGGGVHVYSGGGSASFEMNGGSIHHNSAGSNGGGIHIWRTTFTLNSGNIYNNQAVGEGGGVYVYQSTSTFNMDGGNIYSNSAATYGGVYNDGGNLSGTATGISSNTPSDKNF